MWSLKSYQVLLAGRNAVAEPRTIDESLAEIRAATDMACGEIKELRAKLADRDELLLQAQEDLIWCGGSADFGPGGQAKIGYDKGPRVTIERIEIRFRKAQKPLGAAGRRKL